MLQLVSYINDKKLQAVGALQEGQNVGVKNGREKAYHVTYLWKYLDAQSLIISSPTNFEQVCESYGGPKFGKSFPHLFGGKSTSKIPFGKLKIFVHLAQCGLARP